MVRLGKVSEKRKVSEKGKEVDVLITFDTTGSIYPCLTQVRRECQKMVKRLFADIPGLRIGILAHGDYCDARTSYVTKGMDFSADAEKICKFIEKVERTGGGDAPECYELVLHEARSFSWKAGNVKVVVLIGDDEPHPANDHQNTKKIDWRNELKLLLEAGIKVYGVHAMPGIRKHSKYFYEEVARMTGGYYLTLDQFAVIRDAVLAICYKQVGNLELNKFKDEVQGSGGMNRNMANIFSTLSGEKIEVKSDSRLVPVPAGRFQVLKVDKEQSIKDFILEQGCNFKIGRGFYEFTKPVAVQGNKEVILVHKQTGDIFNGPAVREMLGLPAQEGTRGMMAGRPDAKLKPVSFEEYRVFIQSTSYNRKLVARTHLLYEVEE
jgi:hypothetical protein